jgi:integrase
MSEPHNFRLQRDGSAGNWYVAWSQGRRTPRRSMGTSDKAVAIERMNVFIPAMLAELSNKPDKTEVTIAHVLNQYRDDHGSEVHSKITSDRAIDQLLAYYKDATVADINASTNKQYEKDMRGKGLGNSSINRIRNTLRAALKHAVKSDLIVAAPFIPTLDEPPPQERWLTRKEVAQLLRAVKLERLYYMRLFILVGLYTGARKAAILSLAWDQVDFDEGRIDFRRRDKKGNVLPQTNKRRIDAPAIDKLMAFLRYAKKRAKGEHVIMHRGRKLGTVQEAFENAVKRAGLKNVSIHTLKHTAITWMLRSGVPPWQVSGLTATSLATITKVYGKHIQDDLKQAANVRRAPPRTHNAPISLTDGLQPAT